MSRFSQIYEDTFFLGFQISRKKSLLINPLNIVLSLLFAILDKQVLYFNLYIHMVEIFVF